MQSTISRLLRKQTGRPSSLPATAVAYAWLSSLPAFFFFLGARRGCAIRFLSSSSCSDLEDETLSLYSQSEPRHETGWRHLRRVPCGGGGQEKRPSGEKRDCNHVSFGQRAKERRTGEEEFSDECTGGRLDNIIRLQKTYPTSVLFFNDLRERTMRNGLLHTHPRPLLIIKRSKSKRERASLLLNLGKDGSGSLHLQLVVGIASLVNGCSRRVRLGLQTISCRSNREEKGITLPLVPVTTKTSTP